MEHGPTIIVEAAHGRGSADASVRGIDRRTLCPVRCAAAIRCIMPTGAPGWSRVRWGLALTGTAYVCDDCDLRCVPAGERLGVGGGQYWPLMAKLACRADAEIPSFQRSPPPAPPITYEGCNDLVPAEHAAFAKSLSPVSLCAKLHAGGVAAKVGQRRRSYFGRPLV